ncbi:bifunctional DNA-formamidopyrimidine glycosylase/DNA-(apurinic or apyrimidinic site) lyase [Rubrobacter indicoceani]|uniref:bifunctional DNA-formamidopyrimidine glycosylase/DNA-(apurinic or apyrimidinic site) lyase n=1 Tax=Rubrobacter indicoceani TaxID=2051957 RepID=UPI0013C41324|nr:bifunctional DNA-formamidopyrimidine glycosylase/DNA-(apurinic or apyrimidinic site) lyase [Rubrobacter indicoceani]
MPELPETTVISEDVFTLAGGRRVLRAAVFRPDVTNVPMEEFPERLVGRTLVSTGRRGKVIVLDFGEVVGLVHLVISGRVLRLPEWTEPDRMNTAVLEFEGDTGEPPVVLAFTRLWLGYFNLYAPGEEERHPLVSRLGPDPFSGEFTLDHLGAAFRRKANIKGMLLDQSVVAGLGNIYVDEVLFAAKVNPTRRANTLTPTETRDIHTATRDILRRAIELRGTTFDSYHDAFGETGRYQHELHVFTRAGEPCPRCGAAILKTRVAGRGTYYCPVCQVA